MNILGAVSLAYQFEGGLFSEGGIYLGQENPKRIVLVFTLV